MLIRRQLDVLMHLINSREPLSGKILAQTFQVDVRTIRSDIKKINEFLKDYEIQIKASNQFGYRMDKYDIQAFYQKGILHIIKSDDGFDVPQTPNERISYLFFLLSNGRGYTIEELSELLYISIASIYHDLHIVKRFIEKRFQGLILSNVNGVFELIGEEFAKRNLLSGIISQRFHHLLEQKYSEYINPTGSFLDRLYDIIRFITTHKAEFSFQLTGEGLYSFASDISLCIEREMHGLKLSYEYKTQSETFSNLRIFLCKYIKQLASLNEKNWSYLEDRFYTKNFLVRPIENTNQSLINFITVIQMTIEKQFHINVFKDEKSCEYLLLFLNSFIKNKEKSFYWNEPDKYEIMIQHKTSYMLSLFVSYLLYKETGYHFNANYLAKCSLVIEESFLRNENKKKGILITNKDKEHILCMIHKLVKHFGNTMDILKYATSYDLTCHMIDLKKYDIIISTEVLSDLDHNGYIKISSLCTVNDIQKVSDYVESFQRKDLDQGYEIEVVHFDFQTTNLKEYIMAFMNTLYDDMIFDQDIWSWELEEAFV